MMIRNWKKTGIRAAALLLGGTLALPGVFSSTAHAATPYTAKKGDTFWLLSQRYGIPLHTLMNANKHIDPKNIYPGLTIMIPATPYTAKKGDTFWLLSRTVRHLAANADGCQQTYRSQKYISRPYNYDPEPSAKPASASAPAAKTVTTMAGETLTYSKLLHVTATAYSSAPEENGGWGAVDYFGNPLKLGTIAVDPNVIPFGTTVYITGYDHAGLPQAA